MDPTPSIHSDITGSETLQTKTKNRKFGKSFWRNPSALAFVLVFAAIGGFLLFKSFAASTSYTWDTTAQWATNNSSGGPTLPTYANTMINNSVGNGSVSLYQLTTASTDIAWQRPVIASSYNTSCRTTSNQPCIASKAVDNDASSRWQSASTNPQWIYVNLGAVYAIRQVSLDWSFAFASNFHIDISKDGVNWTTIRTITNGTGGPNQVISGLSGSAQYVRMYATKQGGGASNPGYALNNLAVYGAPTYQPNGGFSVVYNAGQKVKWSSFTSSSTLNGGAISYSFCTAASVKGPWTSCVYDFASVPLLASSQYLRINTQFSSPNRTSTPTLNTMTLSWSSATAAPPPNSSDTTKPVVSLTLPTNGATVSGNQVLSANASDNVGVAKVVFTDNGTPISGATITTQPTQTYSFTWNTNTASVANGSHTIQAIAYDAANNASVPATATVTVNNTASTPPPPPSSGAIWQPSSAHSITWDWQLQGTPSASLNKQVYDIDGFDNTAATVASYHATGAKVICYIDVGTAENFRSDFSSFPASVQGATNGWPGEKWLDIRQLGVLEPIMTARMQMCKSKGFDALEPDNIDGYDGNNTGFPLTASDQATYNTWIANEAHALGLSVGLKNDPNQASTLVKYFDWALDEQCNEYSECSSFKPFTDAGKAVFNAEYSGGSSFCAADAAAHINGALFDLDLTGSTYQPCTNTW